METFLDWLWWVALFGLILPIAIFTVLAIIAYVFGRRWVERFVEPDGEDLVKRLEVARGKRPDAPPEELVQSEVKRQAIKCGVVGAVTGFGGFVTLPVTLPVDMLLTARFQAAMVSFIAHAYGQQESLENKAATYALLSGGTQMGNFVSWLVKRLTPLLVRKSLSKLIPVVGAVISFAVNYAMARTMAAAAQSWYQRKSGTAA